MTRPRARSCAKRDRTQAQKVSRHRSRPTAFRPPAQGCRNPGISSAPNANPNGVAARRRVFAMDATPLGLTAFFRCEPRVAATLGWRTRPRWGRKRHPVRGLVNRAGSAPVLRSGGMLYANTRRVPGSTLVPSVGFGVPPKRTFFDTRNRNARATFIQRCWKFAKAGRLRQRSRRACYPEFRGRAPSRNNSPAAIRNSLAIFDVTRASARRGRHGASPVSRRRRSRRRVFADRGCRRIFAFRSTSPASRQSASSERGGNRR